MCVEQYPRASVVSARASIFLFIGNHPLPASASPKSWRHAKDHQAIWQNISRYCLRMLKNWEESFKLVYWDHKGLYHHDSPPARWLSRDMMQRMLSDMNAEIISGGSLRGSPDNTTRGIECQRPIGHESRCWRVCIYMAWAHSKCDQTSVFCQR